MVCLFALCIIVGKCCWMCRLITFTISKVFQCGNKPIHFPLKTPVFLGRFSSPSLKTAFYEAFQWQEL